GFYLDRVGAALLGASLMVGTGVLLLDQAYRAIDFDTIALLLGMMIVVANLRLSSFFRLVNNWVVTRARHPFVLLAAIVLVAGSPSAFLVNDTIWLVMTPLVLQIVVRLERNNARRGNSDTENFNRLADTVVDPKTNELFVPDGYGNH